MSRLLLLLALCLPLDERSEVVRLLEVGKTREAADALTQLLEKAPGDRALLGDLVKLEMRIGRYASALEHCEELGAAFDTTRGIALYLLARYEEALPYLGADSAETVLYRHEILIALGRFDEAKPVLEQARELLGKSDLEVRVREAQALARAGEDELAAAAFRQVLESNPISAPALFGLGRSLVALDRREEGLEILQRHRVLLPLLDQVDFARQNLELDRSHASNHAALADALRMIGAFDPQQFDEAERAYETASKLATPAEVVAITLRRARFLEEVRRDVSIATQILDEAFALQPDARLAVRAGDVLLRGGRPAEARTRFERALELRPQDRAIARRIEQASELEAKQEGR